MAWAAPRTWVTGELVTAAMLNQDVRDNLSEVGPHVRKYKSENQSFIGTTFGNDSDLSFPIGANETWLFELHFKYIGIAANDAKIKIAMPAGFDTDSFMSGFYESAGQVAVPQVSVALDTSFLMILDASTPMQSLWHGYAKNGSTAGTVQVQFAENSGSNGVTVYKGSWLIAHLGQT